MSGPCSCNGKRYSTAYFTEPVKPTHAPPQSTQELHSVAARSHGHWEIDYDQISKPGMFGRAVGAAGFMDLSAFSKMQSRPATSNAASP